MVVGLRHIHAVMYPFFVFPALKLAQLILEFGVRSCSGLLLSFTELLEADLVSVHKVEVYGLVWVDVINIHVRGLGE